MKKKALAMRIGLLLVALTLITSCFVGGTFAKYVTTGEGTDTARVARWGVTVTAGAEGAFAKTYTKDDDTAETIGADSVVSAHPSAGEHKVIAPGTKGTMAAFTLGGQPETAVRVTYALDDLKLENWDLTSKGSDEFYCPLKFTLNINGTETHYDFDGVKTASDAAAKINEIKANLNSDLAKAKKDFPANTVLSGAELSTVELSWEWPFEGSGYQTDEKDTKLGDIAAEQADDAEITAYPYVSVKMSATVTQID